MYISCGYDLIYPGGGAFPEPGGLETPEFEHVTTPSPDVEPIAEVFESSAYGSGFRPSIFVEDDDSTRAMWPLYTQLAIKASPGSYLVRLTDARIYSSVIQGGAMHDPWTLFETHRPNDRAAVQLPGTDMPVTLLPGYDPSVIYFFLGSAGSSNYGHFLVDDLPRLRAVDILRERFAGRRIHVVMTGYDVAIDSVRRDAVTAICGPDVASLFVDRGAVYRIPALYYASPVSYHPTLKHTAALAFAADRLQAAFSGGDGPERVFVLRGQTPTRRLLNEDAVIAALAAVGFVTIRPADLTLAEQVRAMANAKVIVGQMGAAMTNCMFAPSGADVLYLAPAGWIEPFYWDLAAARDQSYKVLYGPATGHVDHIANADFTIDIGKLMSLHMIDG